MNSATPQAIIDLLSCESLPVHNEKLLQDAIGNRLAENNVSFSREVSLQPRDRIDFLAGSIGIEVKIAGSYTQVANQLLRYAESTLVTHLILVTTRASHRKLHHLPNERGIPIDVIFTSNYAF